MHDSMLKLLAKAGGTGSRSLSCWNACLVRCHVVGAVRGVSLAPGSSLAEGGHMEKLRRSSVSILPNQTNPALGSCLVGVKGRPWSCPRGCVAALLLLAVAATAMGPPRGMLRLAQIALQSYHPKFITDCAKDIKRSAAHMGVHAGGVVPLPTKTTKISMRNSPFVHSKSIAQFQKNTHKRLIELYGESTVGQDATNVVHFLRYLEHTILMVHPGCSARIKLFSSERLPSQGGSTPSGSSTGVR